jgi:hypothetical protein
MTTPHATPKEIQMIRVTLVRASYYSCLESLERLVAERDAAQAIVKDVRALVRAWHMDGRSGSSFPVHTLEAML